MSTLKEACYLTREVSQAIINSIGVERSAFSQIMGKVQEVIPDLPEDVVAVHLIDLEQHGFLKKTLPAPNYVGEPVFELTEKVGEVLEELVKMGKR